MKWFSKIKYAQRNELLKKDAPFSNICEPITLQEAERRILREGETAFALSQEDEATSVPPTATHNPTLSTVHSNATNQRNMVETRSHLRITSPEGWILVFSPP